jgi:hypothetical protein
VQGVRFSGRGFYNYLKRHPEAREDDGDFRLHDYCSMSVGELIEGLGVLGVELPKDGFKVASEDFDSPEEMIESLDTSAMSEHQREKTYLHFFELWKRENADRPSISIFFDDLDAVIEDYHKDPSGDEERMMIALIDLQLILESLTERVKRDEAIFRTLMHYSSHDLEATIYNFIFDLLQRQEFIKASEFIDGFTPFMKDKRWFQFLRIKALDNPESSEVEHYIEELMQSLAKKRDFYLTLALLNYFNEASLLDLFIELYEKALDTAKTHEEYRELQDLLFTYFTLNDDEKRAHEVIEMIEKKESKKECLKTLSQLIQCKESR